MSHDSVARWLMLGFFVMLFVVPVVHIALLDRRR